MTLLQLSRRSDRPGRHPQVRRPLVEGLEGRQLLSGLQGIVGRHIDANGRHLDTSVAEVQKVREMAGTVRGTHDGNVMAIYTQYS
jgi:hypothetical protein